MQADTGLTNTFVSALAAMGTTLYAGTRGDGVFRSEDKGDSWTRVDTGLANLTNTKIRSLTVIGTTLFANTTDRGIFLSKDGGKSWTAVNTGLTNLEIFSLAVIGNTLYAGTLGSGVFRASLSGIVPVAVDRKDKMVTYWGQIKTALLQNYPNPFNPETWIPFSLAEDSEVMIRIYDIKGELIKTLNLGHKERGFYLSKDKSAYWDGRNESGEQVANGAYFVELKTERYQQVRRMVLLK